MVGLLITKDCAVNGTQYKRGELVQVSDETAREIVKNLAGIVRRDHDQRETKTTE